MRTCSIWIGLPLALFFATVAGCQPVPPGAASPQIRKQWALGEHVARDLESRDGRIDDPEILDYVLRVETRVAPAGGKAGDIRLTKSSDHYARLLPHGAFYISAGLLEFVSSESELAGLFAHELAHLNEPEITAPAGAPLIYEPGSAASLAPPGWVEKMREKERRANAAASGYLKSAGYDPSAVLDLFSRLAYEHPDWARAIVPYDILLLRTESEADPAPAGGFVIDSSDRKTTRLKSSHITGKPLRTARNRPTLQHR